jgi:AraC family transcriptional regulator
MEQLQTGQFYGQTTETMNLDGVTLTDTEYTKDKVDWHYHKNAYFTFILQGKLIEGNKKETYNCSAGTLLFHNWQEPHFNLKPAGFTRGFHIEMEQQWMDNFSFQLNKLQGSIRILDTDLKLLLYKIFKETKINDDATPISLHGLLLQTLAGLQSNQETSFKSKPLWVNKVNEILHDRFSEKLSLNDLSGTLGIHPVHLSRDFSKHFHCSIGEYVRKLKIEKALSLLSNKNNSLLDITFECGFSDQSHFIRSFKEITGINPLAYRKLFFGQNNKC